MDQRSDIVRALWRLSILPCLALLVSPQAGHSQTTSITSSGLNTTVTVNGAAPVPTYDITGGTRPGNGTNLFHSFGQFSVGTNDVARFANDSGLPTSNILSRVTGGAAFEYLWQYLHDRVHRRQPLSHQPSRRSFWTDRQLERQWFCHGQYSRLSPTGRWAPLQCHSRPARRTALTSARSRLRLFESASASDYLTRRNAGHA